MPNPLTGTLPTNGTYVFAEAPDRNSFSLVFDRPSKPGRAKTTIPNGTYWVTMRGAGLDFDQKIDITDGVFDYPGGLDTIDMMLLSGNSPWNPPR